jgi:hypothetical protein
VGTVAGRVKDRVLVIRKELLSAFLPSLEVSTPLVFETTVNNRNQLPAEIGINIIGQIK